MKIVSVEQMRALEAAAIAAGTSEAALQEQAGGAVAEEAGRLLQAGDSVVVLVGRGNNGRDGAVAARHLARAGAPIHLVLAPGHAVRHDEQAALRGLGVRLLPAEQPADLEAALASARVALDALLGIGGRGALREPLASLARAVNAASLRRGPALAVVAVDIPSGIDPDSGEVPGEAVWADRTVTFGAVKQGLLRFPAADHVGTLVAREIAIPGSALAALPYGCLQPAELAALVPPRPLASHKYRFGRVLVVAGSDLYLGAPALCAAGAARAGGGLVSLTATAAVRQAVAAHVPEATYVGPGFEGGDDPERAAGLLEPQLGAASALVIGPGLGRSEPAVHFVRQVLRRRAELAGATSGVVVDADALFALAGWPDWWRLLGPNAVLTPHAGELARLADGMAPPAAAWEQAGRLAQAWGCVLVAKGPFTSVAAPDGRVAVWPRANPALASGGTGDVLAGVCGGLLAQGAPGWDAARLAVAAHAEAASSLVQRNQWRTLLASDLLPEIPAALARLAGPNWARPPRAGG